MIVPTLCLCTTYSNKNILNKTASIKLNETGSMVSFITV